MRGFFFWPFEPSHLLIKSDGNAPLPDRPLQLNRPTALPAALDSRFERVRERLGALDVVLPPAAAATAARVCVVSDFVLDALLRSPDRLAVRLADGAPLTYEGLRATFALEQASERAAMTQLRELRRVELARLAWRDIAGVADLATTLVDLSTLADALVSAALEYSAAALEPRFGRPTDAAGQPSSLVVLGMGKLGGHELNFSSDIDLVFVHADADEDGDSSGGRQSIDAETYYRRLAQMLIKLLDEVTPDGFVYRVDTRLRPFGASGPLVVGVSAFESYLVQHGRDWERYAYVKARAITGGRVAEALFAEVLSPFVYRRYLDYGVFDALRQMKRLISAEVARKDMAGNIKLGPGGIREIEFIVQAFQLVRGGQNPDLRTQSLLRALPLLAGDRQLPPDTVATLASAYSFLRMLENRLQQVADRQTHDLPTDPELQARVAFGCGLPSWEALRDRLEAHRAVVAREFEHVAWDVETGDRAQGNDAIVAAWEAGEAAATLVDTPLEGNADVERLLTELRHGGLYQRMDEVARRRLAAVVARTIPLLGAYDAPAKSLERVLGIYRAVCRRSAYLALLNENPGALERLLNLAAQSAWLARQIAEHPVLLDELLDSRTFDTPPTRDELAELFERSLRSVDPDDNEATFEAIRGFQRTAMFRIAIADRLGSLPLMKVSDRLTDTAELVLDFSLHATWRELTRKHGKPMCGPPMREAGFAVIGYGKLGGLELGYGSDLDLVFLHDSAGARQETDGDAPLDNERFFARLVQRLIHYLTIQTSTGRLYEVDTRLRPSGRAGLIVSSLEGFKRYQTSEAWVWEHQALLRSRAVAGSRAVCAAFEDIRREILQGSVDRPKLKTAVGKMRGRMRSELSLAKPGGFDIKQDPGGLADIEFLVDYWVLANSDRFPELVEFPDNIRQLEALERVGLVPARRCERLKEAYLALRRRLHELALDEGGRVVPEGEFKDLRAWVTAEWEHVFGATPNGEQATNRGA